MNEILSLVKQYIDQKHANKTWVAGKDFVNYAGPHFDSAEYVAAAAVLLVLTELLLLSVILSLFGFKA